MGVYLQQALLFLINTLFMLYMVTVLLRLVMQLARVDFYNPLAQLIIKLTNPLLKPLRRVVPGLWGIDMAAVVLLLALELVKLLLISFVVYFKLPNFLGLLLWGLGDLLAFVLQFYLMLILIQAVCSWVNNSQFSHISMLLYKLTDPLMRPVRRLLPATGGFDFSPIPVMIILYLLVLLIANPLINTGFALAL